jgi:hypothetical protein
MSLTKLTPSEVLQRQKIRLQVKSDALIGSLEDNFDYLQKHIGSLVSDSALSAVVSKTPPVVQSLFGKRDRDRYPDSESGSFNAASLLAEGALTIIPLFMKGPKGWIARFLASQAKKLFLKR